MFRLTTRKLWINKKGRYEWMQIGLEKLHEVDKGKTRLAPVGFLIAACSFYPLLFLLLIGRPSPLRFL